MKHKAIIVRDNDNYVYLKIDKDCYFLIEEFTRLPKGKAINLSKQFEVDLGKGE